MEETDMCVQTTISSAFAQQQVGPGSPAKLMSRAQRQGLALEALLGNEKITDLAEDHSVSRKFVYQQAGKARQALDQAFAAKDRAAEPKVLFTLPVTKEWLEQLTLGLTFICHSSYRGVVELFRDVFDYPIAPGSVLNLLRKTVAKAKPINQQQDLCAVQIGAHDEIFQSGQPVLVGADVYSTYCYLLSLEEQRDHETWGIRLLELQERGFHPKATIADAGQGLRAGQTLVMPGVPCRGDVFHGLQDPEELVGYLTNRAYDAIAACGKLNHKKTKCQGLKAREKQNRKLGQRLRHARPAEEKAIALADDVATLVTWLRQDVLAVNGLDYPSRRALFDFIVAELKQREKLCLHRIGPVWSLLENQRDHLLAFALALDEDVHALARRFEVAPALVREVLTVVTLSGRNPQRWQREASLRRHLRRRFHSLEKAVRELARTTVRASSVIENLNSRLRPYFFLRRHLGPDYLALLQFFLNQRRFLRSEHPERVGKSPAELLTGQAHPHWLEMLGYQRFSRN
jgi:hypothetical protein